MAQPIFIMFDKLVKWRDRFDSGSTTVKTSLVGQLKNTVYESLTVYLLRQWT